MDDCYLCGAKPGRRRFHPRIGGDEPVYTGWLRLFFPWPETLQMTREPEVHNVCPKCAPRIVSYVAYAKDHPV